MTIDELKQIVEAVKELESTEDGVQLNLDDAVHDAASAMATEFNNGGYIEQVAFLTKRGYTKEDILKAARGE
jgi:hypothetical protein